VFDDSSPAIQQKYFSTLEKTETHNELYYVGPKEKEEFSGYINARLRDKRLEGLVKNLFRPSYGGNRNFALMYTLGSLMVSADDDMRPYALMEHSQESLNVDEICRGRLHKLNENGYSRKSFDIIASFLDVLGKPVSAVPDNYARGECVVDTAMELETNATKGLVQENSLLLQHGPLREDAIVRIAQTFRSGTSDVDTIDLVDLFLGDDTQVDPDNLNDAYVLVNFRPAVTNKNWRIDCGVAAYDNSFGLPPFFPTRLRFEDYIYRLWVQQDGIASAHVDAAQNHIRSPYMRNPATAEIFNEEVANFLKRKIYGSLSRLDDLGIAFDYDGEVPSRDAEEILEKITSLYMRTIEVSRATANPDRKHNLELFAANLHKSFYGFEPDFFHQNLIRIVDDVLSVIKASIELWPTLVEICYFQKGRKGLPQVRVNNQRKRAA
jgi:hypothetical protein